jgi:hypothetical protein
MVMVMGPVGVVGALGAEASVIGVLEAISTNCTAFGRLCKRARDTDAGQSHLKKMNEQSRYGKAA